MRAALRRLVRWAFGPDVYFCRACGAFVDTENHPLSRCLGYQRELFNAEHTAQQRAASPRWVAAREDQ